VAARFAAADLELREGLGDGHLTALLGLELDAVEALIDRRWCDRDGASA
jgi:hypothetical protein